VRLQPKHPQERHDETYSRCVDPRPEEWHLEPDLEQRLMSP
jgi:hypothetical protein